MENKVQIWHNARCSKSRNAFQWLAEKEIESEWIEYMKNTVSVDDILSVLKKLDMSAFDLLRKKEKIFIENWKGQTKTDEEWAQIMIENPQLIERPIIINGDKAVIARPLENIEKLF